MMIARTHDVRAIFPVFIGRFLDSSWVWEYTISVIV